MGVEVLGGRLLPRFLSSQVVLRSARFSLHLSLIDFCFHISYICPYCPPSTEVKLRRIMSRDWE